MTGARGPELDSLSHTSYIALILGIESASFD